MVCLANALAGLKVWLFARGWWMALSAGIFRFKKSGNEFGSKWYKRKT